MTVNWDAIGAVSTAVAALVALGLGLRGEVRASRDAVTADEKLRQQVVAARESAYRSHMIQLLLHLADEWATFTSYGVHSDPGREALARVKLLLAAIPQRYATLMRKEAGLGMSPDYGEKWTSYSAGRSLGDKVPNEWIAAELGDDLEELRHGD